MPYALQRVRSLDNSWTALDSGPSTSAMDSMDLLVRTVVSFSTTLRSRPSSSRSPWMASIGTWLVLMGGWMES